MTNVFAKHIWFWLLCIAAMFSLIVSQLIQDGVFMDGMLYISVGKNLSDGIGTFWDQSFGKYSMFSYHEQPPLYGGLIAVFFKLFGSSMYVERLFCFVCYLATVFYLVKIWKLIYNENTMQQIAWLPVLFFTVIPVVFWAYSNHVEETVMTPFALAAVYHLYKVCFLQQNVYLNILLAAIFLVMSSLTKGVQGLFPIAAIFFYWALNYKKFSLFKMIMQSLLLLALISFIYAIIFILEPEALKSFKTYFGIRFVNTFNNVGATTDNRFNLFFRLINELLPLGVVSLIVLFISRKHKTDGSYAPDNKIKLLWFLLIGISGSFPLMVTLEQRAFYLVTALPYYALMFAVLVAPRLNNLIEQVKIDSNGFKVFKVASVLLLTGSLIFTITCIGTTKRDKELLHDVYLFGKLIERGEVVSIPQEMWDDWNFQTYMIRYNYISVQNGGNNKYFMLRKDLPQALVPTGYHLSPTKTEFIDLYEK